MSGSNLEDFCEQPNPSSMEFCHSLTRDRRVRNILPESGTRVKTPSNQLDDSRSFYCSPQKPGNLWKSPQYITSDQIISQSINESSPSQFHHPHPHNNSASNHPLPPQSGHHPYDFPLLYHLLMLQNYCYNNYNDFLNMAGRGVCGSFENNQNFTMTHQEPLDLSCKSDKSDNSISGFLTDDNKIAYDEDFKQSEEVEIVFKDSEVTRREEISVHQKKEESVKDFVERKINEYKKNETEFQTFMKESSHNEKDIKQKMSQIKEKYSQINQKIKKLEERKKKLKINETSNLNKSQLQNNHEGEVEPNNNTKKLSFNESNKFDDVDVDVEIDDMTCKKDVNQSVGNTFTGPTNPRKRKRLSVDHSKCQQITEDASKNKNENILTVQTKSVKKKMPVLTPLQMPEVADNDAKDSGLFLNQSNLSENTRVLLRLEAVFHPGKLTCIVPPDIYGVKVDKERGNKPHVFSTEELLQRAILDIRPKCISDLKLGSRVCVFWSKKMNFLHPGIVTGFVQEEPEYVIVSTDDGDTRDVHIQQIRFLPRNFSTLDLDTCVVQSPVPSFKIKTPTESKEEFIQKTEAPSPKQEIGERCRWRWLGEGWKAKKRSKVVFHDSITDGTQTLSLGDYAIFHNETSGDSKLPYLGKISSMWENKTRSGTAGDKMVVKVNWLYHKQEVKGAGTRDIKVENAVFESEHSDDNSVQSITRKCEVAHWTRGLTCASDIGAEFVIVGQYDPVENSVKFKLGLFQ